LSSCTLLGEFEYAGDYPELWSTALGTIPGQTGIGTGGINPQPFIAIEEIDNYGRVLFSYGEGFSGFFVILQKSDEIYVYFYPHYNHMRSRLSTSFRAQDEHRERLEELKTANSWNQPMSDDSEFDRVRIVRRRERGTVPETMLREAFYELLTFTNRDSTLSWRSYRMRFLRGDRYGRAIYEHGWGDQQWAFIFQPDHAFDIETSVVELIGDDYQTDLRLLMEANGWNTPP
jgi:hypothetical protein